jgi:CheY-like chemotaxis protein
MDGRRALVIDDEVHFRYFLRVLLEKAGFAVKMARNGIEALDVLPLDVMMPEQSGLTFYGAVCRDEDWKRIPVVMLSAVPISVREHAFATIGLTQGPLPAPAACLEKPCTPEALLEVVNRLVPEPTTA